MARNPRAKSKARVIPAAFGGSALYKLFRARDQVSSDQPVVLSFDVPPGATRIVPVAVPEKIASRGFEMAKQILDLAARRVVGRGKGLQGEHGENQRGQPARTTPARWHRARAMFTG